MKRRLMRESKLGAEYTWDVISTCDQNGLQAIADEEAGEIFIYDPKKRVWATSQTMRMADADIWELVQDQALYDQTMMSAKGEKWEQFKAEWNALCNVKNEYPYQKTPRTDPIGDEVAESRKRRTSSDQGMNELVVDWYKEAFPTDTDMFEDMEKTGSTFADVWDALDNGEDVYAVIGADDSIVRERVFDRLAELTGKDYDVIYNMWLDAAYDYVTVGEGRKPSKDFMDKAEKFRKRWRKLGAGAGGSKSGLSKKDRDHLDRLKDYVDDFGDHVNGVEAQVSESGDFDEDIDNPNDWSASEGEVEIVWDNDFPRFGIESGDTEPFVIDYDRVDTHDMLLEEVVRLIEEAYPGIEVGTDDFVIDNEDEFWEQRGGNPGKWDDDDLYLESSSNEEEFTVKWIIDDEVLGIEIGDTETVVVDLDYVDSFEELVRQATMELKRNHQGMLFVYDVDWLFPNEEELLKRFGYTMDESD